MTIVIRRRRSLVLLILDKLGEAVVAGELEDEIRLVHLGVFVEGD